MYKLTDNEIINIKLELENHINFSQRKGSNYSTIHISNLKNSLDLINRLQEEKNVMQHYINHLQKESEKLNIEKEAVLKYHPSTTHPYGVITPYGIFFAKTEKGYDDFKKNIKAEAYKEFAEGFKDEFNNLSEFNINVVFDTINNLLKEKVGDKNVK